MAGYFSRPEYERLNKGQTEFGQVEVWQSINIEDKKWDAFLAGIPFAHFEQTSMWAHAKNYEGWQHLRVLFTKGNEIIAGFQILKKTKYKFLTIGHILKGPVVKKEYVSLNAFIFKVLNRLVRKNKIAALIVQPPFEGNDFSNLLIANGARSIFHKYLIKDATVIISTAGDLNDILMQMKATKRQNIKKGLRKGISTQLGDDKEIKTFFNLMLQTCSRKNVAPNPSNITFFEKIWSAFSKDQHAKIFISSYQDKAVSGVFVIPFGNVVYTWKFGWSGEYHQYKPNDVLYWEVFKWAKKNNYDYVDLVTISPDISNQIKKGEKLAGHLKYSSSSFKLDFGGKVAFYPDSSVYFYNPFLRWIYDTSSRLPLLNNAMKRVA